MKEQNERIERHVYLISDQLQIPTILPIEERFSTALIMKSATSAREILKPKGGRCPSRTRYFRVEGLSVSSGGRTIVQSSPLFLKISSIADASETILGKSNRPRRYAGGMIESLNRKATDSTTTRLTPACGIALVSVTANRCNRFASA